MRCENCHEPVVLFDDLVAACDDGLCVACREFFNASLWALLQMGRPYQYGKHPESE